MSKNLNNLAGANVLICLFLILLLFSCNSEKYPSGEFDILISNATIIDGTGEPAFLTDLLIKGDSIVFIGKLDYNKISAQHRVDAKGKVLSPGFIDVHAHGDPLTTPGFENFLNMGVTTICIGQDGFSQPVENLSSWIAQIDSAGVGVNVLTFIGHSTLRELSGTKYSPVPKKIQTDSMVQLLRKGMAAGAFGMSTGLEYTPGYFAEADEMAQLAEVVGEKNGLIMSHMRNEDDDQIEKSINELLIQGWHAPVHISHFKVVYGQGPARASRLLSILDSARKTGIQVTADVYPYTASYTGIGIVFPDWAKPPNDFKKVVANRRNELKKFLHDKVMKRNGPQATLLGNGTWRGMTLAQVSDSLNLAFEDVLIDVIGPDGASGAYFVMNEELQSVLIRDSLVCISSDGSPTMHHPRGYGSFPKIIRYYVNEARSLPLEEAIRKMTSLPASILGLEKRGLIKVGYKADLLVFDTNEVKDVATYEDPHKLAVGFEYIIVNGNFSKAPGVNRTNLNGKFLKK